MFTLHKINVMDEEGNIDEKEMPEISVDEIKNIYRQMCLARALDLKMLNLQKQGRMGTFASVEGQEGCQVALSFAIKGTPNVWIAPTFRENACLIAHGVPMLKILKYWGGYEDGSLLDKKYNVLPVSIPVGSQAPHAVGLAQAMNIKGEKGAAIAFFGDGGSSTGEANEALNFAGVFNAPAIFFCQDNQYAISVPRKKQTAAKTIAQRAHGFGIDGVQVDGNDVFAVYKAVKQALAKALKGEGPTLIEAVTYRMGHHTTADDWKKYRDEKEVEEWRKKDPILRLKKFMLKKKLWDDDLEKRMQENIEKEINEAVKEYESLPPVKVEDIFDFTYAELPTELKKQKKQWIKFWGEQ